MRKLLPFLIALAVTVGAAASAFGQGFNGGCFNCGQKGSGGGGGGVTWSYKTNATGGGGSSVTLTLGAGVTTVSGDITVLLVTNDGGAVPNSVTIGGNAATLVSGASDNTGVDTMTMWSVSGVTLGSATSVVVGSAGTMFTVGVQVGVISGSATPTPNAGFAVAASFSDPFTTGARTVPSGGIMIVGFAVGGFSGGTPASMTIDNVMPRGSNSDQFAHTAVGTGASITATYTTSANQNHGVGGIWSP